MSIHYDINNKANERIAQLSKVWFGVVFLGQLLFVIYIIAQYVLTGLVGDMTQWNETSTGGYVDGDAMGNVAFAVHVFLAMVITLGGPLQLLPAVRQKYPRFHRINGRVYFVSGLIISMVGIYLIWVRGTVGDTLAHSMTTLNGLIIIVAAIFTVRHAIKRQIDIHQKWAIRFFLAMSGVFFFRVFLNFWLIASQGKWIDFESFTGPALDVIGFFSYIGPVILFELCLRSLANPNQWAKRITLVFLVLLIIIFIIGIIGATAFMWWPRIIG